MWWAILILFVILLSSLFLWFNFLSPRSIFFRAARAKIKILKPEIINKEGKTPPYLEGGRYGPPQPPLSKP